MTSQIIYDSFPNLAEFLDLLIDDAVVIRFYYDDPEAKEIDGEAYYAVIVGYTMLGRDDCLIHYIDVENAETLSDLEDVTTGHFQKFSSLIGQYGFDIVEADQLKDDEDYD